MSTKNVVICCNPQWNYFHSTGSSYLGDNAKVVLKRITSYLDSLNKDHYSIIYTRDVRSPEDNFYAHQKTQCVVGDSDLIMMEGLPNSKTLLVSTTRPSALWRTPVETEIKKHSAEKIILIGAETHASILFTAADLKTKGYNVIVLEPLIVARDEYSHCSGISILTDILGVTVSSV